jgi:hypothetical protein
MVVLVLGLATSASAIPSLQLGPGTGTWEYDTATQTWVTGDNPFNLMATANATTGNGDYAWEQTGTQQFAYLVLSAVPQTNLDAFSVSVLGDGPVTLVASGYGAPPLNDPNSLAPHGIFDTYFEVYEFRFDGPVVTIDDTQPGGTGSGDGYKEFFDITVNSMDGTAIHADLFTVSGDGKWKPGNPNDRSLVEAFAPFSHDAEYIPEPTGLLTFAIGLLVIGGAMRRR